MRLRRIILLDKKQLTVLFVRTFYVAEAQCLNNPNYYEIPAKNEALVKAFLEKYSVESEYRINFKAVRDSCDREDWFPVYSLNVSKCCINICSKILFPKPLNKFAVCPVK